MSQDTYDDAMEQEFAAEPDAARPRAARPAQPRATVRTRDPRRSTRRGGHRRQPRPGPEGGRIDPTRRIRQVTDTTSGTETRRILNHYNDTDDSPAWIATSTNSGVSWTWDRNIQGIDGNLDAIQPSTGTTQLQLSNLHGDVVATVENDVAVVGVNAYFEQTEYGLPRADNGSNPTRYGWLGAKQRAGSIGRCNTGLLK